MSGKIIDFESVRKTSIILVGLGPHSKRIYIHYLKKYNIVPKLVVDLVSNQDEVVEFLNKNEMKCETYFVSDTERNAEELSSIVKSDLDRLIKKFGITHAIISTEPKAHFGYSKYFLERNISTLIDKPITSPPSVSTDIEMAKRIERDYNYLRELYSKGNSTCIVQCQRRWHRGYVHIKELLKKYVRMYKVPITSIEVYHCDGMWNMPDEFLFRENHPYKYGYGKLFHSGYHFIDIMCWLVSVNNQLMSKEITNGKVVSMVTRPSDFLNMVDNDFYNEILKTNKYDQIYKNYNDYDFAKFGELDVHTLLQFYSGDNLITNCTLNLLQNGFSRRSWVDLPPDTYKSNGRVRHERINIQVGPLLNIQIHSYQSKEVKERSKDDLYTVGNIEHFDIDIFRNVDLIGGKPFERVQLSDLIDEQEDETFIGYNEAAREDCILEFLSSGNETSDLEDHNLSIKVLSNNYVSICQGNDGVNPVVKFTV